MRMKILFGAAMLMSGHLWVGHAWATAMPAAGRGGTGDRRRYSVGRGEQWGQRTGARSGVAPPRVTQALDKEGSRLVRKAEKPLPLKPATPNRRVRRCRHCRLRRCRIRNAGCRELRRRAHGDHEFLMVPIKPLAKSCCSKTVLEPVFVSSRAGREQATADYHAASRKLAEKMSQLTGVADQDNARRPVHGHPRLRQGGGGTVLDIREIQGRDWGIAISPGLSGHSVRSIAPRGCCHRVMTIKKNITFGRINISSELR